MTAIFGENLSYLGSFGILYATFGVVFLFISLVILLRESKKAWQEGRFMSAWRIRVGLPIAVIILSFVFAYAIWTAFEKVYIDGQIGSESTNKYRFVIGSGLGVVGTIFLVISKWGGEILDYPSNHKKNKKP